MKRHFMLFSLIFVFLGFNLFPASVYGQKSETSEKEMFRDKPLASENSLDLTPEQTSKLRELRKIRQEERREFLDNMRKLRLELRELMRDPEANEKEIRGLYDKMSKLQADNFTKFVQRRRERRNIFSPEQLEKLEKIKNRIDKRRNLARARFFARRGFSRLGPFPRQGRINLFWRRGRDFRGRPFMNRWHLWRQVIK